MSNTYRRRMSGIPPLADGITAATSAPTPTPPAQQPTEAPQPPAAKPTLEAPKVVAVAPVRTDRRRMGGPSNARLALEISAEEPEAAPAKQPTAEPGAQAAPSISVSQPSAVSATQTSQTTPYEIRSDRRRMAGASNVALADSVTHTGLPIIGAKKVTEPAVRLAAPVQEPEQPKRRMGAHASPAQAAQIVTTQTQVPQLTQDAEQATAIPTPTPEPAKLGAREPVSALTKRILLGVVVLIGAVAVVLIARWLRSMTGVEEFIAQYDGHSSQPAEAPVGLPAWMGWQHFLNMFFIVLIIRTGLQVRHERRPSGYWTPKKRSFFSPGNQSPKKVPLSQWLHQTLDVLWVLNGLIFVVLLFVTGHWMRIVPTDLDIFPNMLSAAIQYASLDWPTENGWIHYNSLQVVAYFVTVFIAAPLAIVSGIRFSTWWPSNNNFLNKIYPVEFARAVHFPVMIYFVAFTAVHVFLVFFTGALRNLNHMYTSRNVVDGWGLVIFLVSVAVIAAGWIFTNHIFVQPVASKMGKVTRN